MDNPGMTGIIRDISDPEGFLLTKEEAKALYTQLKSEFITRDPEEHYIIMMRLMNGLGIFVDEYDKRT